MPSTGHLAAARPRSGAQHTIAHGGYSATIASVGATLRKLSFRGRPLVAGFDADEVRPMSRGALLAPWPNRLADGTYEVAGRTLHVPITEPDRNNANHGFVGWQEWAAESATASSVTLVTRVVPNAGYPFDVVVRATYTLDDDGLSTSIEARNVGSDVAPYGLGAHPYLVAGAGSVDDWTLSLPAETLVLVDDRLLPTGTAPVADDPQLDFREPRRVGDVVFDNAFTDLVARDGLFTVTVTAPEGTGTAVSWDPVVLPWTQVYSSDKPGTDLHRAGLAVEPMTCPANAFNTGAGLVLLEPGAAHVAEWRVRATEA